jgi:hypothetical protein
MNRISSAMLALLILPVTYLLTVTGVDLALPATSGLFRAGRSYSHDSKGLEKEWAPLLKALSNKDAAAIAESYKIFVIPDYQNWFATFFKKDDVEQLGWDYEAEINGERRRMIMITGMIGATALRARCEPPSSDPQSRVLPRKDAVAPAQPVPVEQFMTEISSNNGKRVSFLTNYVYIDGAFRYVGRGAYPFWSMPDATRPEK